MSELERHFAESESVGHFARAYFAHLHRMTERLDPRALDRFAGSLIEACEREAMVYFLGNGGSAATASHYANDLNFGTRAVGCKAFRTASLMDNNAVISCVSNDVGYDRVFTAQLDPLLRSGDVLVALSVSGNSANIVQAVDLANARGATSVGLTGVDGGALARQCHIHVHVPSEAGEYGPVEDVFQMIDHMLTCYFQLQRRGRLVGGAEAEHHMSPEPVGSSSDSPAASGR